MSHEVFLVISQNGQNNLSKTSSDSPFKGKDYDYNNQYNMFWKSNKGLKSKSTEIDDDFENGCFAKIFEAFMNFIMFIHICKHL